MKAETAPNIPAGLDSDHAIGAKPNRQVLIRVIAVVAVLAAAIWGGKSILYAQAHQTTDDAYVATHIDNISPQIQGVIKKVLVEDNQLVKKGDLLVQLVDDEQQAAVAQARANYDLAVAQAKSAGLNVDFVSQSSSAQMEQAQGVFGQNEAGVSSAQSDVAKAAAGQASAQAGVASARAGYENAKAAYASAIANLSHSRSGISSAVADFQTAQASAQAAAEGVRADQATATRAQKDAARAQSLVSVGAISQSQADAAQAAADNASAIVAAAQAQSLSAQAVVRQRQEAISAAKDQLAASQALVSQAQAQISAAEAQLKASGATVTQADAAYKAALDGVAQAQQRVKQANGQVRLAQTAPTQIAESKVALEEAKAKVEQAKAALDAALTQLSYTKILAPLDGRVNKLTAVVGALVQPLFPLLTLVPSKEAMWVIANFKETQLGPMRIGQPVELEVDGIPGRTFHGKVDSLAAGTGSTFALLPPDNATGNFTKVVQRVPVKITFDPGQPDLDRLAAGLSVNVAVQTK